MIIGMFSYMPSNRLGDYRTTGFEIDKPSAEGKSSGIKGNCQIFLRERSTFKQLY
jgi:hypothetical protein